jgi:hypothetical protein
MSAYSIQQRIGGQAYSTIKLDEITYNVEMDDALFAKPSGGGAATLF